MPTRRFASRRVSDALAVGVVLLGAFAVASPALAQTGRTAETTTTAARPAPTRSMTAGPALAVDAAASAWVPELGPLAARASIGLRDLVERYGEDRGALGRRYDGTYSPSRRDALRAFDRTWLGRLTDLDFDVLDAEGRVDYVLLRNEIEHNIFELAWEEALLVETADLLPFAGTIHALHDARRNLESLDPREAAGTLTRLAATVDSIREAVEAGVRSDAPSSARTVDPPSDDGGTLASSAALPHVVETTRLTAFRAAGIVDELASTLEAWYRFHHGYDPFFTWWAEAPYAKVDSALTRYRETLRQDIVGIEPGGEEPIVGEPLGRDALLEDLAHEMIPYSPEELIAVAREQLAWGIDQMRRAAREMGHGDDWRAALEAVKQAHVPPGEQPNLIRELALEAEAYMEQHDLVTVPPLAKQVWRMEMMSPERQRVAPFFLGGERILVSYPTHEMSHEDKLMSMRGNNPHFSRATVHHELIPGHHLQGFMSDRHFSYRDLFGTPFWSEGNAFYWETLLWDRGFFASPEDRIGALFWRNHRAARIIFSLSFHLGEMTPEQCIDLLVEQVGHERANAEAEVRRSFNGSYSPLYQTAYMMGGLQFRTLHAELVDSGQMTDREFHDAILQGGRIPVELVLARLTGIELDRDWQPEWRFLEQLPPQRSR
ncbi:MAG: DUF885 family protein [Longimicrobiales bacterium]